MTKSIEWTEETWNPIVGCSIVSPGCTNCYAMGPLARTKPTVYFVNSMSDLFHASVPDAWIDRVFAVMALCPQHTFQVLSKRSVRMREYFAGHDRVDIINGSIWSMLGTPRGSTIEHGGNWRATLPLPNVWLGVSAERQQEADERIPDLLATPAAVRFVSCEPLLGPLDLERINRRDNARLGLLDALRGQQHSYDGTAFGPRLDWVIVGGESGPGARPMHPDWARSLRNQCSAARVPFFSSSGVSGRRSNPIAASCSMCCGIRRA